MATTDFITQDSTENADQWATDLLKKTKRQVSAAKSKAKRQAVNNPPESTVPRLEYQNDREIPVHRLPFVGGRNRDGSISYWNVPKGKAVHPCNYAAGNTIGANLAMIYINHIMNPDPKQCGCGGLLQNIILDMTATGTPLDDQRKGELVGFAITIEKVLLDIFYATGMKPANAMRNHWLEAANKALEWEPQKGRK